MPRLTDERRASQRLRVINAARLCFMRQGFQATTMAHIIRESGMSAGAVYGYFTSKQDLCLTAMTEELLRLRAALDPVFNAPPATLRTAVQEILSIITALSDGSETDFRRMAIVGLAEAQRNPEMQTEILLHLEPFLERFAELVRFYAQVPDPAAAAHLLLSVIFGRLQSHVLFGVPLSLPDLTFTELSL